MIVISQKCQYALRGIYQLAKQPPGASLTAAEIASAQAIPQRFLELILKELRQAGLIKSYRGPGGGHVLARPASEITVGQIIQLADGPTQLVKCVSGGADCPFVGACPFRDMWNEAVAAMHGVFDRTTIQSLLDKQTPMPDCVAAS